MTTTPTPELLRDLATLGEGTAGIDHVTADALRVWADTIERDREARWARILADAAPHTQRLPEGEGSHTHTLPAIDCTLGAPTTDNPPTPPTTVDGDHHE